MMHKPLFFTRFDDQLLHRQPLHSVHNDMTFRAFVADLDPAGFTRLKGETAHRLKSIFSNRLFLLIQHHLSFAFRVMNGDRHSRSPVC